MSATDVEFSVAVGFTINLEDGRAVGSIGDRSELAQAGSGEFISVVETCEGDCTFALTLGVENIDDAPISVTAEVSASTRIPDKGPTPTVSLTVTDGACD